MERKRMSTLKSKLKSENSLIFNRHSHVGDIVSAVSEIYQEEVNISIWQRKLNANIIEAAKNVVEVKPNLQISEIVFPNDVSDILSSKIGSNEDTSDLRLNIFELVNMFCYLFDLKKVGFRLTALDYAMCPRFHVDNVPCRLITTYYGIATEWLPHHLVDRSKLGQAGHGKLDEETGIFQNYEDIKKLDIGHVGLLKGESWPGNQGAGLVHRSPKLENGSQRLLVTLDFVD
jgi:hypothetical protein